MNNWPQKRWPLSHPFTNPWPRPTNQQQRLDWDSHSGPYRVPSYAKSDLPPVIEVVDRTGELILQGVLTIGVVFFSILLTFGIYIAYFR